MPLGGLYCAVGFKQLLIRRPFLGNLLHKLFSVQRTEKEAFHEKNTIPQRLLVAKVEPVLRAWQFAARDREGQNQGFPDFISFLNM